LFGGFERYQDAIQRQALVVNVGIAFQLRIVRDQLVGAADLDAGAGVIDDCDIGVARVVFEIA
jgi:hypothetical protein